MRDSFHSYPPKTLFLRAFKQEKELEVWAGTRKLRLIKTFPILAASGVLGPKLQRGDRQVPEGWYHIDRFNPKSRFHLSLGLNYPNEADQIRSAGRDPGSDIFIHGSNVSIGCLAMGNPAIEEIYGVARDMKTRIQVVILPSRRIDPKTELDNQLKGINDTFETKHFVPKVRINRFGAYEITPLDE
ncbi:MAG: L,D-transpeptidase family protein [Armatimonadota bacterium]